MSWWSRATESERLAQIDGCIEVGMTVKQCAMNCRASNPQVVHLYAARHGRSFGWDHYRSKLQGEKTAIGIRKRSTFSAAKEAFISGAPVDFWSVE